MFILQNYIKSIKRQNRLSKFKDKQQNKNKINKDKNGKFRTKHNSCLYNRRYQTRDKGCGIRNLKKQKTVPHHLEYSLYFLKSQTKS
ncbi:hypothetical protein DW917_07100 [Prevotella sp. AM42-24]|nr:hypothetical protein DW917_07100 [Prevotella sp. AM42-24]